MMLNRNDDRMAGRVAAVILGLILFTGLAVSVADARDGKSTAPQKFVGESPAGDFQAALDDALVQADRFYSRFGADIQYSYIVLRVRGVQGGIAGERLIRVEIRTISP
jgi:hypothetical protein